MINGSVKKIIQDNLEAKKYTACALGIQSYGEEPEYFVVGKTSLAADAQPVDSRSLFDIASLTKVMFTTTLAADAYETGKLSLDSKLKDWIPDTNFENHTIEELLLHEARFKPGLHYETVCPGLHKQAIDHRGISKKLIESIAKSKPSTSLKKMDYSDVGFVLLAEILSNLLNESSEDSWLNRIQKPLKLATAKPAELIESDDVIVATDMDLKRGEVHDPDARFVGKLCGHAGLFSNIEDMMKFGAVWLGDYLGEGKRFKQETIQRFIDPYMQGRGRALGWDIPSADSTAGNISPKSIGHLGFTGTSIWIDLEKKRIVTLLTNRVIMGWGKMANGKTDDKELKRLIGVMNTFRRIVHNEIWETCFT
jgi:CubicO group peptidase (beta-lactamase class C family)